MPMRLIKNRFNYFIIIAVLSLIVSRSLSTTSHNIPTFPSIVAITFDTIGLYNQVKSYNYAINNVKPQKMVVESRSWYYDSIFPYYYCIDRAKQVCQVNAPASCSGPGADISVTLSTAPTPKWITTKHNYQIDCPSCTTQKFYTAFAVNSDANEAAYGDGSSCPHIP